MSSFINSILSHEGVNATVALARRKSSSVTNTVSHVFSTDKKDKEDLDAKENHVSNHAPQVNGGGGGLVPKSQGGVGGGHGPTGSPPAPLPSSPAHRRPLRLKNVATHAEAFDTLHFKSIQPPLCQQYQACVGSIMFPPNKPSSGGTCPALSGSGLSSASSGSGQARSREEILHQAKEFLDQYFTSIRRHNSPAHHTRWDQVQREVTTSGTYQLTEVELVFGAKTAWRNSSRCIGRIQWSKLQVFDCRSVTTTTGMFEALCNHIKYGTNKGNIRSAITIFPQRTDGKHDFRVWNQQLIAYAGYKNPDGTIIGDPLNVEFTEACIRLGWKGKGTRFDILPLVLSANGHDPDYFDLSPDLVMEVTLTHPKMNWFEELGLRWFVLPAVSGMLFDVGGIEFPAAPFNGWYMGTEIGCRNLCDAKRYNILETVAQKMGLDTRAPGTLWKDRALVEVNVAVLFSFQSRNVTIVDHHSMAESFMKHYENENRLRSGCPADWVWIVPPMSGSATPVFHQEMAMYTLKPSYEYQEAAWRTHVWKKGRGDGTGKSSKKPRRKFHFKQIARAVKFTSKLFGRALSRRIKATVLYATETGKSEAYAKKLGDIFGHAFNAQVYCMDEYDMSSIEHEALLLVVTSTFGNGDPPENGQVFAQNLYAMKMNETAFGNGADHSISMASSKSFIKANSCTEPAGADLPRSDAPEDHFGPLSNVRFAVFALGSSAYPNFCAFGQYVDNLLGELGGERLLKMESGDEMCGQEQAFRKWAPEVFGLACETFCLDDDDSFLEATMAFKSESISPSSVRFVDAEVQELDQGLSRCHNRRVRCCTLVKTGNLHGSNASRATLQLEIQAPGLDYQPGDHVGVFAINRPDLVEGIIKHLQQPCDADKVVELQLEKESHTSNGVVRSWEPHPRLPRASIRTLFSRFLDVTTPPSPQLLQWLATQAKDSTEQGALTLLATDSAKYEDWRHWRFPHLLEVLEEFPSVRPPAALLCTQLTTLQPRFYSISSSPQVHQGHVHLTVAVVSYRTQGGDGPEHFGVCSTYLQHAQPNDQMHIFVRSAPSFHLPSDISRPIIMVGPGTGVAPFRGFWHHRQAQLKKTDEALFLHKPLSESDPPLKEKSYSVEDLVQFYERSDNTIGPMWLFFGCRQRALDLYKDEKAAMLKEGVLDQVFLALSREPSIPKTYVQDLVKREASAVYRKIVLEGGHFFVCGDCTMAEHVYQTLKVIIQERGSMTDNQVERYMLKLRDENRYHEDIFGITLRTAEVHNRSRESARNRMASQSQ